MPQRPPSIDLIAPALESAARTPPGFRQPWPDPREAGLPPPQERLPAEWTSDAPPATERMQWPLSDWLGWLVALAVLLVMATFGFHATTWALRGGWNWLWLGVGPPVFGVFAVSAVWMVVSRLRERRRIRVALENMSLERGEGFRVGEPLALRLRATVAVARDNERTVVPERLLVRLVRRAVRSESGGGWTLVDECCDEAVAAREEERDGRLRYACELCASPAHAAEAAQWSVELRDADDPAVAGGAPFMVAALRLLPAR